MWIDKDRVKDEVNILEYAEFRDLEPVMGYTDRFPCPWRESADSNGFWISDDQWYDHVEEEGGNAIDFVMRLDDCNFQTALKKLAEYAEIPVNSKNPGGSDESAGWEIIAEYDYRDELRNLLYQVCRKERTVNGKREKTFIQRSPEPGHPDIWVNSVKGVKKVPYRLPDFIEDDLVFIVEGEKDVDRLFELGVSATCNSGGAGKWDPDFAEYFEDMEVVILPDNDEAGRKHGEKVAQSISECARCVTVFNLDVGPKGDVSDWLDAGHGGDELLNIMQEAPDWNPKKSVAKPVVNIDSPWLDIVTAVADALNPHDEIFNHGGEIVRLESEDGVSLFQRLTSAGACSELERFCEFVKTGRKGDQPARLHENIVRPILQAPTFMKRLPRIDRIADYPVPLRVGDSIEITKPGYCPETCTFTDPSGPVPEEMPLERALDVINDLLHDFCFAETDGDNGERNRMRALAYILTCHTRGLVEPDRSPIFIITGNRSGVGKDYLLGLGMLLVTGRTPVFLPPTSRAEETRKRIFSVCRTGRRFMMVGNFRGLLSDVALEQAATSPVTGDRILGKSEDVNLPNTAIYGISGNGMRCSEDIARRACPIALEFLGEEVEDRTYEHPDLYGHVLSNRATYLGAFQAMVRKWIDSGCPAGSCSKSSFNKWAEVVGGILESCGLENPIGEIRASANAESEQFRQLLQEIERRNGVGRAIKKEQVRDAAIELDLFTELGDLRTDNSARSQFGYLLKRCEGRRFDGLYLHANRQKQRPEFFVFEDSCK